MMGKSAIISTTLVLLTCIPGCDPPGASDPTRFDHMETTDLRIADHTFRCWIANNNNDRQAGFMYVEAELLERNEDGTYPGMVFVFPSQQPASEGFWMRNVPVPLDIAFVKADGTIVTAKTMAAYDTSITQATASYRYTIEAKGGLFGQLGISEGDKVELDPDVLASAQ